MSVERNFYLGPYAECIARDEHRAEGRMGCVNRASVEIKWGLLQWYS